MNQTVSTVLLALCWLAPFQLKDLDVDVLRAMADFHSKTPAEMKEAVKKVRNCTAF